MHILNMKTLPKVSEISRQLFAKISQFREIIILKFREIIVARFRDPKFKFSFYFVFCQIKNRLFVSSTLPGGPSRSCKILYSCDSSCRTCGTRTASPRCALKYEAKSSCSF
jgi:hypothetical protein